MSRRVLLPLALLLGGTVSAQTVTIGVFGLFHPRDLNVGPAGSVLVVEAAGEKLAIEDRTVHLRLSGNTILISVGTRSWRAAHVRIHSRDDGAADLVLAVPGKIHRHYHGVLDIASARDELTAIVTMDLELAVASAAAAESPPGAPLEALKAQAVATRSFYAARASGHREFDFCDTTHCQFLREPPADNSPATRAARETRGMVLTYKGSAFAAMFSSSCGGRTKTLAELGLLVRDYPYFAVECRYCREHAPRWTRDLKNAAAGERARIQLDRQHGWSALPGNHYELRATAGGVRMEGSGLGHGLGLCQRGAAAMAAEGKSFQQILDYYYPNTIIVGDARSR